MKLQNIGPIPLLEIDDPTRGAVVVLRGCNGVGKTTALNAIESLLSGRSSVSVRDGEKSGEITGFGASIRVGLRRATPSGKLEVVSLEGKLSPASLVDPGINDDVRADAARIKTLLQLVKVEPQVSDFYALFGGDQEEFQAACPEDVSGQSDAVAMAAKIKRELEATARRVESSADSEAGKRDALRKSAGDVDVAIVTDKDVLQANSEAAVQSHTQIKLQREHARRALNSAAIARQQLEQAERDTTVVDYAALMADAQQVVKLAENVANEAADEADLCREAVRKAQEALTAAEARSQLVHQDLSSKMTRLEDLRKAAKQSEAQRSETERSLSGWRDAIEAAEVVVDPTDEQIEAAAAAVTQARKAIEDGALACKAIGDLAKAKGHDERANELAQKAAQIREAARGTDEILSGMVARCGTALTVKDGRLWLETRRGPTLFAELSHGERWKVAIDVAVSAFNTEADGLPVIVICQEAWEGLDPFNRQSVVEHAHNSGVVIYTAENSDEDTITTEVL
jgi:energy-coupling factor transporter ATP-binding protein EcfA2